MANDLYFTMSAQIAGQRELRFARAIAVISSVFFLAAVPFATRPLLLMPAFIPAYESGLVVCDLIIAVVLLGQFNILRSWALMVLACGYAFSAFIACSHALTFPGVFSRTGLLGAGSQTTLWLYMFWHGGFPPFVLIYSQLKNRRNEITIGSKTSHRGRRWVVSTALVCVTAALAIVWGLTFVATAHQDSLPALISSSRYTPALTVVVSAIGVLSLYTLVVLWRQRPHTVLDVWLMVVMYAWLLDIALSAGFSAGRFDLGWYAGRIYGLFAALSLLVMMLVESVASYSRLARLSAELKVANESLERLSMYDALTALANRRFFDMYLADQFAIARRHDRLLGLILLDADYFKAYNDHYGHQAGDECLKQIATALRSCCSRSADLVARYGGEEFAIILPDTDLIGAAHIADEARDAVARLRIPHAYSPAASIVTVSGGVAVSLNAIVMTATELITAADESLYLAKNQGRNRMVSVQSGFEDQQAGITRD